MRRKDGIPLQKSLFETIYQRDFHSLGKDTAWYLDPAESVHWWHRIATARLGESPGEENAAHEKGVDSLPRMHGSA